MSSDTENMTAHVDSTEISDVIYPGDLRAGDRLHVRADGVLSTVVSHEPGRAGTEVISLDNHPAITVAGETKVCIF